MKNLDKQFFKCMLMQVTLMTLSLKICSFYMRMTPTVVFKEATAKMYTKDLPFY